MDWSKVNYSSARAALNEVWRHIEAKFAFIVEQVIVADLLRRGRGGVRSRAILTAPKGCPDFWEMPGAYLAARWIGPGRGYVDPVKEAQSAGIRMDNLTSTLEDECAETGSDWEDVLDQAAIEKEELAARGLVRAVNAPGRFATDPDDDPAGSPATPKTETVDQAAA